MASFVKITLDTLAPSISSISLNSGASYTTDRDVVLALSLTDTTTTGYRDWETDRKSTRLNSSHSAKSRMPSSA